MNCVVSLNKSVINLSKLSERLQLRKPRLIYISMHLTNKTLDLASAMPSYYFRAPFVEIEYASV